jgi:hypothetical protein
MESPNNSHRAVDRKRIRVAKALILSAAFLSFVLSVVLWFNGDRERGMFVGIWVPSICSAGALLLAGGRDG